MALTFTDEQCEHLLAALGLPLDTGDSDLVTATVSDLAAQAAGAEQPSSVAAAAKKAGLEVVDAATLTALRNDAAEGRKLVAAAAQAKITAAVDNALAKGKITPARREHWIKLIGADPGMADVLASVPAETAVPLTEIGHGMGGDNDHQHDDKPGWFY